MAVRCLLTWIELCTSLLQRKKASFALVAKRPRSHSMSGTSVEGHLRCRRRRTCLLTAVGFLVIAANGVAYPFTVTQADSGARVYQHQCARCHGPNGEGKDDSYRGLRSPELIGATALPCNPRAFQKIRTSDFRTVKDVYEFVSATMPADQPASLSAEEYWNVVAFILQRNGRAADDQRLNDGVSRQITLHSDCLPAAAAVTH